MGSKNVLIIGAGGVGNVVAHQCAQQPSVFGRIMLASRTLTKCDQIVQKVLAKHSRAWIETDQVDADDVTSMVRLIKKVEPKLVINVALPYQDLTIMEACLEAGADYLDTANYEPLWQARFCYEWQWALDGFFQRSGRMALLGCGFDPGVTSIYCMYALKHYFRQIHTIDILDCNGGSHDQGFATNFNPEINIREITQFGKYYAAGRWWEIDPIVNDEGIRKLYSQPFDFPQVGVRQMYLIYHEELQSLARFIPGLAQARFWMTFGKPYLQALQALVATGMTSIEKITLDVDRITPLAFVEKIGAVRLYSPYTEILQKIGLLDSNRIITLGTRHIAPIEFLKLVLPEPSSLGAGYTGKTNIGCIIEGIGKDGKPLRYYIYNVCDHAEAFRRVGGQAITFTTGVPAALGAEMMLGNHWSQAGVFNVEQMDPDPFMNRIGPRGLPFVEVFGDEVPKVK